MTLFLRLYDYLNTHRRVCWMSLAFVCLLIGLAASRLRFEEDIVAFLPLLDEEREQMHRAQQAEDASRIYIVLSGETDGIDAYLTAYDQDTLLANIPIVTPYDPAYFEDILDKGMHQLPSVMTDVDYNQIESIMSDTAQLRQRLIHAREQLQMPISQYASLMLRHDPYGLFTEPLMRLRPQDTEAIQTLWIESPYGSTESRQNAILGEHLLAVADSVRKDFSHVSIEVVGAPVIAAGNAQRIKRDSAICLAISILLILLILIGSHFTGWHQIGGLVLSTAFGFAVGLAALGITAHTTSMIILGIGSILIGIAVNYPLHVLFHRRYTTTTRETLEQVLSPLIIGNITTVGAFLALLPMQATALRDLGIFAAAMLIGTILFSIIWLPQLMGDNYPLTKTTSKTAVQSGHSSRETRNLQSYKLLIPIIIVSILLGWQARYVQFDTDLSHINYMSPTQREIMSRLSLPAVDVQSNEQWNVFWQDHGEELAIILHEQASELGFRSTAFLPFEDCISREAQTILPFDYSRIAQALRSNFDYLGTVCSVLVFAFLFLSFSDRLRQPRQGFRLAFVAFLPMMLSWCWILGIMHLMDLQFNIVNIILATFIFGQGDDYTIFMVEGVLYERRTGQPMLPQYRNSILLSAAIMLVGIGVLILAKHPAMHSLGAVTLIGMLCVVTLAYILPPLLMSNYRKSQTSDQPQSL